MNGNPGSDAISKQCGLSGVIAGAGEDIAQRLFVIAPARVVMTLGDDGEFRTWYQGIYLDPPLGVAIEQIVERIKGNECATFKNEQMGAQIGQIGEDVRANQDGFALIAQFVEQGAQLDAGARVEAACGLIEHQDVGVMQECACEAEALGHTAGETHDEGVFFVRKVDKRQHIVDEGGAGSRRYVVTARIKVEVFESGHRLVDAKDVGHKADTLADSIGVLRDRHAVDHDVAATQGCQGGEHAHGGGFAGAIGANQADRGATWDCAGEGIKGYKIAVCFADIVEFNHTHAPPLMIVCLDGVVAFEHVDAQIADAAEHRATAFDDKIRLEQSSVMGNTTNVVATIEPVHGTP